MSNLEPSYLRYIYYGLEKGDLNPDNASALPEGLIGLYEAAFKESKAYFSINQKTNTIMETIIITLLGINLYLLIDYLLDNYFLNINKDMSKID